VETDPVLSELRDRVADADRRLLEVVNERLGFVRRIRDHKREQGIDFVDPEQERRLVAERQAANAGPLSDEGVEQLLRFVLDLTKRELGR
jgi:chorismate mutase